MRYISSLLIVLIIFILSPIISHSTEYITRDLSGQYIVLIDTFSTSQQERLVNKYVKSWSIRNNSSKQLNMYYRIRNHIARLTTYDNDAGPCYTPYGVIYNHRAVCMGYALLAKLMFDSKGIQNELIYDTTANHLYNRACLDGNWQYIDITKFDVGLEKLLHISYPP